VLLYQEYFLGYSSPIIAPTSSSNRGKQSSLYGKALPKGIRSIEGFREGSKYKFVLSKIQININSFSKKY